MTKFTSDDWDYVMKMNPILRREYQQMMEFDAPNPILAEEIDKKIREYLNNGKEKS